MGEFSEMNFGLCNDIRLVFLRNLTFLSLKKKQHGRENEDVSLDANRLFDAE